MIRWEISPMFATLVCLCISSNDAVFLREYNQNLLHKFFFGISSGIILKISEAIFLGISSRVSPAILLKISAKHAIPVEFVFGYLKVFCSGVFPLEITIGICYT